MKKKFNKETAKKVSKITLNVLFYALILLILSFAIANMKVKTTADIPNFLGGGFLSVQSDSMNGSLDDSFNKGDLIFVDMLNDKERAKLKEGDIITFYGSFYNETTGRKENFLNTHRIVKVIDTDPDNLVFITQGDKVAEMAGRKYGEGGETDDKNYETVEMKDALAVHKSTWRGAGNALDFLQSPTGFGLFIVLPTFVILVVEAFFLIRNVLRMNKEKMEKEFKAKDEELRKQLMEELRKEQETKNNA